MKTLSFATIAVLSLGLMGSSTAYAARSKLAVNHLHIQLIDLDPTDGIAPTLSFREGSTSLAYFRSDLSHYAQGSKSEPSLDSVLGPLLADDVHGSLSAQSFGGALTSAQGWSGQVWVSNLGGPVDAWSSITLAAQFTLTAHTLMLVSGDVPTPQVFADGDDATFAESVLRIADTDNTTQGNSRTYLSIDHGVHTHLGSDHLQASFANLADKPVDGSFFLQLTASATNNSFVSGVPEADKSAALLAGLAVLGAWVRRHKRR